jgi:hypothetical protein
MKLSPPDGITHEDVVPLCTEKLLLKPYPTTNAPPPPKDVRADSFKPVTEPFAPMLRPFVVNPCIWALLGVGVANKQVTIAVEIAAMRIMDPSS